MRFGAWIDSRCLLSVVELEDGDDGGDGDDGDVEYVFTSLYRHSVEALLLLAEVAADVREEGERGREHENVGDHLKIVGSRSLHRLGPHILHLSACT